MPWLRRLVVGLSPWTPGFTPGYVHCDMWWTTWQWDRVFSKFFTILLSVSFHRDSPYPYIICGINNTPIGSQSSEILSHPIDIINMNKHPPPPKKTKNLEFLSEAYGSREGQVLITHST
jgi:hypothetical protein